MKPARTPTVLIILDGFGYRENGDDNAIAHARTPTWDRLWQQCPHTLIATSGLDVGLPDGQMGNSEVGHMSLGAGRIVYQQITRIDKAIADGDFFNNPAYCRAIDQAIASKHAVHIIGLLSPGGVHSHQDHIFAMIKMARQRGADRVYVHAILDGRDTPPRSAKAYLAALQQVCDEFGATVASIVGRYYAMDRDQRWDRVARAYRLYSEGQADFHAANADQALQQAYQRDEDDEFVQPTLIAAAPAISDGDAVIFMNFRADRARELSHAFVDKSFSGFERPHHLQLASFVMTSEYEAGMAADCAFPTESLSNVLGEYIAGAGKTQLRIAETEKYAHVTFFFSGGREQLFDGEQRILVPSPDVATYDLQPAMSAPEVTEKLVAAIQSGDFDLIVCNYANGDMVGHTGVFSAAVQAVETLDSCLKQVTDAVLSVNGHCLITADHGNCEQMHDHDSEQPHTQHTTGPVPLVYVGKQDYRLKNGGRLADIAPSLLSLMGLPVPPEMTGRSLLE
ncbi:MAG TPA: 2,3-bisphosphoglycerate-independent phosphoglycerate mutase [Pseudomonadales bacterium]